jgi:hypothetical protein
MATDTLQTESESATESERLYAAWRYAKAIWDTKSYAPGIYPDDLPQDIDSALCDETAEALNRYLLHPAEDLRALACKLRVYRDEELYNNWYRGADIASVLVEDARRFAFPHG